MNIANFSLLTAGIISTSAFNVLSSGFRGLVNSKILNSTTTGSGDYTQSFFISTPSYLDKTAQFISDSISCMGAANMVFCLTKVVFDHQMNPTNFIGSAFFIPLATRSIVCLTNYCGVGKSQAEFLDKNLGKILNVATLVISVASLPALLYTAATIGTSGLAYSSATVISTTLSIAVITSLFVKLDVYCLYKTS